jgi:hypothetical protein
MRIHHIIDGISIIITNEERRFISKNDDKTVTIESLDDHDQWVAQNLVRKGVYTLSKDKKHITRIDNARESL